ncbi:MAG: WD40 repeat domain-containing protein, partial [Promethearchaeia archaeon]
MHAALSSISAFLTQLGLTSTARSLDSELEKKGGCRLLKSIEEPESSSALDMLLLAALDPAHDPEHSKPNAQRASQRPSVRQQYGTVTTRTTGDDRYSSASFRTNSRSFAARLRAAEVGGGGLSRDSRQLQTAADKVRISHCEPVALLRGHREPLVHLEVLTAESSDPVGLLFSASLDNTVRLWKPGLGSGECHAVMRAPSGGQLSDARAMSNGKYAACCTEEGKTYLLDMAHQKVLEEFALPNSHASAADFEGAATMSVASGCTDIGEYVSSTLVATATRERCIPIWDTRTASPCMVLKRSRAIRGYVRGLQFGSDMSGSCHGTTLLLSHGSQTSVIWDLRMNQILSTLDIAAVAAESSYTGSQQGVGDKASS